MPIVEKCCGRDGRPGRMAALRRLTAAWLVSGTLAVVGVLGPGSAAVEAQDCARRLVSTGDDIPAGHDVSGGQRYPDHLLNDHLKKWGSWCEYDIAKNTTSSSAQIAGGQLAQSWNLRPDLITITVGGQNATIVNLITSCFEKAKDHDFVGASVCAASITANAPLFTALSLNLTTILQQYRVLMAGRPSLVVAVTGYPNPFPKSLDVFERIAGLCAPLVDTMPTCTARWVQFPPALDLIDQVFRKLNSTIATAVAPFATGSAGRVVYVDTYTKLRDHCMAMEVAFRTQVAHGKLVHEHDSPASVNFGCSKPWFVAGSDGTAIPLYLEPAVNGVLISEEQTTSGMGVYPTDAGHKCISDLIWEADTIEPGVTPLKWKLGAAEAPVVSTCQ